MAPTVAAFSLHPLLSRPGCVLRCGRRLTPLLLRAASSSTANANATDFNITFTEPTPTKKASPRTPSMEPPVPWIVRGKDGKPTLQTAPPPEVLQAIALAEAQAKKAKKESSRSQKGVLALPMSRSRTGRSHRPGHLSSPRRLGGSTMRISRRVNRSGWPKSLPPQETRVDISKYSIYVNGNRISKKLTPKLYFAVNKPKGYICSCGEESKSVVSLFNDYLKGWNKIQPGLSKPRLFTVGRLDVATADLIIVTNDDNSIILGEFAQKLKHPSSNVTKEYVVTINGAVHKKHLIAISEGTKVDGVKCVPDLVEPLVAQSDTRKTCLKIVVYALKRVRIGRFKLPADLGIGRFVELKQSDIKALEGNN